MAFKDDVGSLDRIAKALEDLGGLPDIPTPTISDAGKVLGVNNLGAYALASAGSGIVIPTYTVESGEETTTTCDMTYEEVRSAIENHECICCILDFDGRTFLLILEETADDVTFSAIKFDPEGAILQVAMITHFPDDISFDLLRVPLATGTPPIDPPGGFNPS